MDNIDRKIIEHTQAGLPLCPKPFEKIAALIGVNETDVINRMKTMQENGMIRRIAAIPNHYALGFRFNAMTVWDISDHAVQECGLKLSQLNFVSHCYQRPRHLPEWPYNLFAMIHGKSQAEIEDKQLLIKSLLKDHCRAHQSLISKRILKKTGFRLAKQNNNEVNNHV